MPDRRLDRVEPAEVFELPLVEVFRTEGRDEVRATVLVPLVGEIVDGVHGRGAVQRAGPLHGVHVHRHEGGVPVVGVHDVGYPVEDLGQFQRATRQEDEPLQVVAVAVQGRPVVVVVVLQQVHRDRGTGQLGAPHAGRSGAEVHRYPHRHVEPFGAVGRGALIERSHHPHVDTVVRQRLG